MNPTSSDNLTMSVDAAAAWSGHLRLESGQRIPSAFTVSAPLLAKKPSLDGEHFGRCASVALIPPILRRSTLGAHVLIAHLFVEHEGNAASHAMRFSVLSYNVLHSAAGKRPGRHLRAGLF